MQQKVYVVCFNVYLSRKRAWKEARRLVEMANLDEKKINLIFSPRRPRHGRLIVSTQLGQLYEVIEERVSLGDLLQEALKGQK